MGDVGTCGGDGGVDVAHPFGIDLGPLLDGEAVGFRGGAVVFAGAEEVFRIGESRAFPVRPQLLARRCCDGRWREVRFGLDVEVGVTQHVTPVVLRFRDRVERVGRNFRRWDQWALRNA